MSRVLVIASDAQVSRKIGDALSSADFPAEYSAGHADIVQRLRMRSFGVEITTPDSTVEEDLALLDEMRAIRSGIRSIVFCFTAPRTKSLLPYLLGCSPASHLRLTP